MKPRATALVASARNGREAVELFDQHRPPLCFIDVQVPGMSGIEAAQHIGRRSHVVCVTGFEQYAVQAFAQGVLDDLVMPVEPVRLAEAVARVQERLAAAPVLHDAALLRDLARQIARERVPSTLRWVRAQADTAVRLFAVDRIDYLQADSRYTRVAWRRDDGRHAEALVSLPLRDLLAQPDPGQFVQIHRSTARHRCSAALRVPMTARASARRASLDVLQALGCNRAMFAPPSPRRRRAAVLASALVWLLSGCAQHTATRVPQDLPFPLPPAGTVVDTYFGTPVADPYRALEDLSAASTQAWMQQAADHAQATLARIPGRQALRDRLAAASAGAAVTVGRALRTPSGLWVYERRLAGEEQFALVARQGAAGADRVLVDVPALSALHGGRPAAVNFFSVSPDGRTLAFGSSASGSEESVLHRIDVASGRPLGEPVTRANFGVARWTADGRAFSVNRLQPAPADPRDKYHGSAVWLLGADGRWPQARLLLGPGMRSVDVQHREAPQVLFTADGRWMIGFLEDGVRHETRVLYAPAALPPQGEPDWRPLLTPQDGVVDFAYGAGVFYAKTHAGAPRFRIVGAPIESFSRATAPTLVPASDRVLGMLVAARDALYFQAREGNAIQLWKLPHGARAAERVALPLQGHFALRQRGAAWAAHGAIDGLLMPLEDLTHAPRWVEVDAAGQVRDTGLQPPGTHDTMPGVQTTEVLVRSHDGVQVPLSIVHRRGQVLDGSAPTLLQGYGAYGFTWEARFDASRLAWLEQGGVIAMANPRGGGVFGQAWHDAGRQATKPNTWRDMIACAEYLVAQGWASPRTLAIEGASAGGITSGRAATERPDLFAAAVLRVGALDMVRAELEPNGPPNVPEFGSHATEPGFRALLAMSTYHHVEPGVRYPAVLLTHGIHDPRVSVWHSSKTAARLVAVSAARPDGQPVLLRLDMDGGHGVVSTRSQWDDERADIYAFLLWRMGVPGFQPQAPPR